LISTQKTPAVSKFSVISNSFFVAFDHKSSNQYVPLGKMNKRRYEFLAIITEQTDFLYRQYTDIMKI